MGTPNESGPGELYERWRRAYDLAREAEARISEGYDLFLKGQRPEPSTGEIREAGRLRQVSVERLNEALRFVYERSLDDEDGA